MKDYILRSECEHADIPDSCFAVDLQSDDLQWNINPPETVEVVRVLVFKFLHFGNQYQLVYFKRTVIESIAVVCAVTIELLVIFLMVLSKAATLHCTLQFYPSMHDSYQVLVSPNCQRGLFAQTGPSVSCTCLSANACTFT